MVLEKYALLDTDFLFKLHITHNTNGESMMEYMLKLPAFRFVCHEQILIEIDRHDGSTKKWLSEKIAENEIALYSDKQLLVELQSVYENLAFAHFIGMLKNSCDTYSAGLYNEFYGCLENLVGVPDTKVDDFIQKLQECDLAVGTDNNLGEIKLFTMAQVLCLLRDGKLFVFCSDDRKARVGIINANYGIHIECVSALAAFLLFKEILHMGKTEAKEFFDSWMTFHSKKDQYCFRVYNNTRTQQLIKVEGYEIFDGIYDEQYGLMADGYLRIKDKKI